nr:hypothetical protein [Tanacetum cinerariifolium]
MLLEGSELTKEDRESQLYDEFEHFKQHKEKSINDYYVRFSKLINDMRNIKMTMPKLQLNSKFLNSKFVNNMLPEWARFVMALKLNKGLRESNYDQLFAYLKQHEAHAKENKIVLERLAQPIAQPTVDPLALLSNVSNTQHGLPSSSTLSITPLTPPCANSTDDLIENLTSTLALLTQSYETFLPQTNNQLRTSSNLRNQAIGGNAAVYREAQNKAGNVNQGQARPVQARTVKCYICNGTGHIARNCTQSYRPQNSEYFKDKMQLMQAQENRVALDAEQLLFLADCDAFDLDVDEAPTAQTMFMANLSSADPISDEAGPSYDSDILSEVQDHNQYLDDTCAYQEEHVMYDSVQLDHVVDLHADHTSISNMIMYDQYVKDNDMSVVHSTASSVPNDTFMMIYEDMEQVKLYERRAKFELTEREQEINEQLRLVISDRNLKEETLKRELHSTKLPLYNDLNKVAIGYKNPLCLTRAKQAQPALYNGHEILKDNHAWAKVHNSEVTLEIAELTRKKINAKMIDLECVTHKAGDNWFNIYGMLCSRKAV